MSFNPESYYTRNYYKAKIDLSRPSPQLIAFRGDFIDVSNYPSNIDPEKINIYVNTMSGDPLTLLDLPVTTPYTQLIVTYPSGLSGEIVFLLGGDLFRTSRQRVMATIEYDDVGLAREDTLSAIKSQTDKLLFDSNSNLGVVINDSAIMVPVDIQGDAIGLKALAPYPLKCGTVRLNGSWDCFGSADSPSGYIFWSEDTTTPGSMEIDIYGTKFGLVFQYSSDRGIANIYVDDTLFQTVDLYSPSYYVGFVLFDGLSDDRHTIKVEVSGNKNDSSTGYKIAIAGLYVESGKNAITFVDYMSRNTLNTIYSNEFYPNYNKLVDADESVSQSISLDVLNHPILEVYAKSTTATNFYLDVSPDNSYWIEGYKKYENVTEVKDTLYNGYKYVKLRSDPAGTSGTDTVTLILSARG